MSWTDPSWVLCLAKPIPNQNRRAFTEIGVAWEGDNGSIKIATDVPLLLTPELNLFLFPKGKRKPEEPPPVGKSRKEVKEG